MDRLSEPTRKRGGRRRKHAALAMALWTLGCVPGTHQNDAVPTSSVRAERLLDAPLISPETDPSLGDNIQGPSLIRVPSWVREPLGLYYLYFADHKGDYIRLAYADELLGPWKIYGPGSLQLNESHFATQAPEFSWVDMTAARLVAAARGVELQHDLEKELTAPHIASPDVHVDAANQRIVMYYHGLSGFAEQSSRVATSTDGIHFDAQPQILGKTYLRAFSHAGATYGLAMPGQFYRSEDGFTNFETGPKLFGPDMRHAALLLRGDILHVFWSRVGDAPERILLSTIDVSGPWEGWSESAPAEVLRPERRWEGADAPPAPSVRSVAYGRANQLRDPAIFEEDGRVFLLYATAGESGIGIAELHFEP